ncbi:site-specific DNA-methyltransferase [Flagellimonas sediminis]|uniref:site-specific DNA-methyltransferase (adenine-specific) n=1 Tax=Flagellimonas sediminis TaxID=2696468 RepID=A0A6I5KU34_9FLAO|nr:site-specific DNA-methyltransferase [Allomuricauda sediminis]NDV42062.1 site-specific DNA-methyltransferase [Allomuricauda sediminis]
MAKKKTNKQIEQYKHSKDERANIPHVGLVTPASDPDTGEKKTYEYDPHLDPQLQWAGKAEHTSFEVPTVSLHVHERIDPKTIIETVKKEKDDVGQMSLFSEKKPLREAIDFYKHNEGWTNRLIAGDSLLVMNSLLEKEGMASKVQMVYFDPPYGIKYGSNFQPFVNKRDVKDGNDGDLTAEPEMIKAFRDTWELGIHSYLTYLRDRLLLAREMLNESGSVFVQISDENVHHVREIMDEVFGRNCFVSLIAFTTTSGFSTNALSRSGDYIVWYCKDPANLKFRKLFKNKVAGEAGATKYKPANTYSSIPNSWWPGDKLVSVDSLTSQGPTETDSKFLFDGKVYYPPTGMHWKTTVEGLYKLAEEKRIVIQGNSPRFLRFFEDYPVYPINNLWTDTSGVQNRTEGKIYVVQTASSPIQRCMLMTTDPGDLVLDITCGSGTTATVAEEWGRRWMTCDTSRVALSLTKQRLMTANYDYYKLAYPKEGVSSGFDYKTVPHITLKSIANNEPPATEILYDQPLKENGKTRITGPFTVEAVPAPYAKSFDELEQEDTGSDNSIARSGETNRQAEWRDELLRAGVRAKGGNIIQFTRVEPLAGTKYIQAEAETKEDTPKKVLVVFGPEHAPLEQRMVENAWQESRALRPDMLLFCAFQFDEEAAKDIDELTPAIAGMQLIKAQMNADMLTDDLRKKRSSNESFWLVGQPDVRIHKVEDGKIQVEVMGFDYYNPKTGNVESGGKKNIAMWMLDTDYDNRSLYPSQVFFPMAGAKDGWVKLAKNLKAEIDEEKIEAFKGTISLPFESGSAVAVKIIDDRGIESLRVLTV